MNIIKKILYSSIPASLLMANYAFAYLNLPDSSIGNINQLFAKMCIVVNYFFTFVMIVAVVIFLIAAFTFLTEGDKPEGRNRAKDLIIWGIVGILVAILPKAFIIIAGQLVGVSSEGVLAC